VWTDPSGLQSENPCMTPAGLPEPNGCNRERVWPTAPPRAATKPKPVPVVASQVTAAPVRFAPNVNVGPQVEPACRRFRDPGKRPYWWGCLTVSVVSDVRVSNSDLVSPENAGEAITARNVAAGFGVSTEVSESRIVTAEGSYWQDEGTVLRRVSVRLTEVHGRKSAAVPLGFNAKGGVEYDNSGGANPGAQAGGFRNFRTRKLKSISSVEWISPVAKAFGTAPMISARPYKTWFDFQDEFHRLVGKGSSRSDPVAGGLVFAWTAP
jgi:hypothetical protein